MARASGLYPCISQVKEFYEYHNTFNSPIYSDYMIFSPLVPFFNDDNFDYLDKPIKASIITSPTINKSAIINEIFDFSSKIMSKENKDILFFYRLNGIMTNRIEKIFKVAIENEVDSLVLGAFGCGVFGNNPKDIVNSFNEYLKKYKGYFEKIVFAVYDSSELKTNYKTFNDLIEK